MAEAMKVLRNPAVVATRSTILLRRPFHGPPAYTKPMPGEEPKTSSTSYLSLYATTFMVGVVMISLGPLLDPITKELDIPLAQAGLISVAFAVGMLVGVIALNFLLARVPVKWALIGAVVAADRGPGGFRRSWRRVSGRSSPPTSSWASAACS